MILVELDSVIGQLAEHSPLLKRCVNAREYCIHSVHLVSGLWRGIAPKASMWCGMSSQSTGLIGYHPDNGLGVSDLRAVCCLQERSVKRPWGSDCQNLWVYKESMKDLLYVD